MKKINILLYYFFVAAFLVNGSCKKDPVLHTDPSGNPNYTPSLSRPPFSDAGEDQIIVIPPGHFILSGSASDSDRNIINLEWKKISGPTDPLFEPTTPTFADIITYSSAKVHNLSAGIYDFELTATDKKGLYDKDTISITIVDLSSARHEIIFQNLNWECPWGCSLSAIDLYNYFALNTPFLVYIKRDSSSDWIQVATDCQYVNGEKYVYGIFDGQLIVFDADNNNIDETDTPDLKIAF
jgi:hypothetical protein